MPLILTLDAALIPCSAGLVQDGALLAACHDPDAHALPTLAHRLLVHHKPDLVAVTVGPGSFTGLRAAIALAHGIAIGAGIPVVGVTLGAAMATACPPGRTLWTVIDNKRGQLVLECCGHLATLALDTLPRPDTPIALAGDAAPAVAAHLAANGADSLLLAARAPTPLGIAHAAITGPTRPPLPLYVDPPHAQPGPPGRPPPM